MTTEDLDPGCGRVQNELAAHLYGELPPDARAAIEQHLDHCAACREELAGLHETRALLARWETPPVMDDARELAARVAAAASLDLARPRPPRPKRARLVRWSAMLSGAAAATLFVLSVLGARFEVADGRVEIGFALPGAGPRASQAVMPSTEDVRALVAQEVAQRTAGFEQSQAELLQGLAQMNREELLRLAQAVDYALAHNQETWNTLFNSLTREAKNADLETRQALENVVYTLSQPR